MGEFSLMTNNKPSHLHGGSAIFLCQPELTMTNKSKYTPDNLWVVAENQMVGYCACDASNGALFTYERKEDAQERAEKLIKRLNGHLPGEYDEDSWAGVLLRDCIIGDNQERIIMPFLANQYGEEKTPYTTYTIEEWNKMFPNGD